MTNFFDFASRTILVTGASSGIGRATAVLLSRLGARIVGCGRNPDHLAELTAELHGEGHFIERFDLADADAIPGWLKGIAARTGPLDGLVHSAGVAHARPLRVLRTSDIASVAAMDVTASMMLLKGFRQKTVRNPNRASAVLVSSVAALRGQPARAAYSATKGAMVSLTRSLALELGPEGLRINCICAGLVRTAMYERSVSELPPEKHAALVAQHVLGLGEPDDVAKAAAFLLSDAARWITGTALVVDGGYSL